MKIKRKPTSPGEILREEYLIPLDLSQKDLANHIACDVKVINRLVNAKTTISAKMALKLGAALNTSPEFWLNAQKAIDLYEASKAMGKLPKALMLQRQLAD